MVQSWSSRRHPRAVIALLTVVLAGCALTALSARPAAAAPRDLSKLVPNAIDIVKSPAKYAGSERTHLVVRPGRVALMQGAGVVATVALPAGPVSLATVATAITRAGHTGWIEEQAPGVFLLRSALVSGPGTVLTFEAPEVREVRLLDHPELYISAVGAVGRFTGVTVTSWRPDAGAPVTDASRPRPFVQYAGGSRLEIVRSTFAYLGSDRASAYGINWHQSTGKAVGSVFHHNFFGGYTYAADGVVFSDNVYRDNAVYGLDPHTASKRLVVTGNRAFRNKVHGIVFSIDVTESVVRGNHSHDNGANGIVMDDRSDRNVITGNLVERNKGDGIVLLGSSRNRVEGNTVRANRTGLRVNLRSVGNRLLRNTVTGNEVGAEVYGGAHATELEGNRISGSARVGMTLEAPGTHSLADQVSGSPAGLELRGVARVERTRVSDADKGVVVTPQGIAEITGVSVSARSAGVEIRPGGLAKVRDSVISAPAPLAGAEPRVASGNRLTSPAAGPPLLALVGIGFLLLAVALFGLQRLRGGRRVEAYWVGQARADRHSRRARKAALARAERAASSARAAAAGRPAPSGRASRRRARRARPVRLALATGGLIGLVAGGAAAAATVSGGTRGELVQLAVRQAGPAGQVQVRGGDLDLPELAEALAARGQRGALTRTGKTWLLTSTVILSRGARLTISEAELRLASGDGTAIGLEARGGTLVVERSTVTSWDRRRARPDGDVRDGRAWVLASGGRLEVRDSRMLQLGYDAAERGGVSWLAGAGGMVEGSTLRGNATGLVASGADRLRVRGSIVEHARRAGIEPGGTGLVLDDNVLRHNGGDGVALTGRAPGVVVTGNVAYANRGHGIAVRAGAGQASLSGNEVYGNRRSGIDVEGAAGVRLAGNVVYGNQFGVTIHDRAAGIGIEANRVTANRVDGVRVSTAAQVAVMRNNLLDHNLRAGAYLGAGTASIGPGNRMTDNETGMWLAVDAGRTEIVGNRIAGNVLDGVHLVNVPKAAMLRGNEIEGNRKAAFSVAAEGAAKGFTAGNRIGEHPFVERVRVAEGEGGLRKGIVGQALDE
jgi:parallel beta-helix repeat protein